MNLYGVFWLSDNKPYWAMTTNKRQALRKGKELKALVTVLKGPKNSWFGPWDAPTLRAVSALLADFRTNTVGLSK